MTNIDAYRQGYEAGLEERKKGIIASVVEFAAGLALLGLPWTSHMNEAYEKGYQDGKSGEEFDPPEDED